MVGMFYPATQHLQWVIGPTPLQAGLWTLPYIVVNIVGAMLDPALAKRLRPAVVALGLGLTVVGAVMLVATAEPSVPLPLLIGGISVVGLGQGASGALISDLIICNTPADRVGSAAAAQEVGGELGTALCIATGGDGLPPQSKRSDAYLRPGCGWTERSEQCPPRSRRTRVPELAAAA